MSRLDRARWDSAKFPVVMSIPVRFDDLDILGHVNNVAAAAILQEARVDFNRQAGRGRHANGLRVMAVGLAIEFAAEMHHGEPIEVSTGVLSIGRTFCTLAQVARQKSRSTLYASATLVFADATGPTPIPALLRAELESLTLGFE